MEYISRVIEVSGLEKESLRIEKSSFVGLCFERSEVCRDCDCDCDGDDCSALLVVANPNGQKVEHKLPLMCQGKPLNTLKYGRLMSLMEGSLISVLAKGRCSSANGICEQVKFRWRIITQTWKDIAPEESGSLLDYTKYLICAECRKSFETQERIEKHIAHMHKIIDPNSVWNRPLKICYQDHHLAVVVKPQGISVQGAEGLTLQRSDLFLQLENAHVFKPIAVHRLDCMTGGLLLVAKSKNIEGKLKQLFQLRKCKKRYRALVFGRLVEKGDCIVREPVGGKPTETRYQVLYHSRSSDSLAGGWITVVDLFPITGRRHQLRRHLKYLGHPIWGDRRYAAYPKTSKIDKNPDVFLKKKIEDDPHARLCLYAMEIAFPHPATGKELTVIMDEPEWLKALVSYQEKLWLEGGNAVELSSKNENKKDKPSN